MSRIRALKMEKISVGRPKTPSWTSTGRDWLVGFLVIEPDESVGVIQKSSESCIVMHNQKLLWNVQVDLNHAHAHLVGV